MGAEGPPRADGDCPRELFLGNCLVSQGVHPHRNLEVVQIVQEEAEVTEFLKGNALGILRMDQKYISQPNVHHKMFKRNSQTWLEHGQRRDINNESFFKKGKTK